MFCRPFLVSSVGLGVVEFSGFANFSLGHVFHPSLFGLCVPPGGCIVLLCTPLVLCLIGFGMLSFATISEPDFSYQKTKVVRLWRFAPWMFIQAEYHW